MSKTSLAKRQQGHQHQHQHHQHQQQFSRHQQRKQDRRRRHPQQCHSRSQLPWQLLPSRRVQIQTKSGPCCRLCLVLKRRRGRPFQPARSVQQLLHQEPQLLLALVVLRGRLLLQ